jgi:hypothetical protein
MPDWKGHLAFEDSTGRYPAKLDIDASTYVRCRIYGKKFAVTPTSGWFTNIKVDKATGASLSTNWPGKIVNVAADLLEGIDPETGREQMITLTEHRALLAEALARAGHVSAGRQRLVIEIEAGRAEIVSVETVG